MGQYQHAQLLSHKALHQGEASQSPHPTCTCGLSELGSPPCTVATLASSFLKHDLTFPTPGPLLAPPPGGLSPRHFHGLLLHCQRTLLKRPLMGASFFDPPQ